MILRIADTAVTLESIVERLRALTDDTPAWYNSSHVTSSTWSINHLHNVNQWGEITDGYYKIWLQEAKLATLLLLYI